MSEGRRLPIFQVAEPCTEDWYRMEEMGEHRRHCSLCNKQVHDLTGLREDELYAWLETHRETPGVCARFFQRADGTLVAGDCTPWRKRLRDEVRRRTLAGAARLAAGAATFLALLGVSKAAGFEPFAPREEHTAMGTVEPSDALPETPGTPAPPEFAEPAAPEEPAPAERPESPEHPASPEVSEEPTGEPSEAGHGPFDPQPSDAPHSTGPAHGPLMLMGEVGW